MGVSLVIGGEVEFVDFFLDVRGDVEGFEVVLSYFLFGSVNF